MNNNEIKQIPIELLNKIKSYLSNKEYQLFIESLNNEEKKGLSLNINKLIYNKELHNEIISLLNLHLFYENNNYNYYYFTDDKIKNKISIGNQIYHHQGLYYVQEPSASLVIKNINITNNDKILDLCAAPGGKTINALFNNQNGFIISNDIDKKRAIELSHNIESMGFENAIVTNNNPYIFNNNFNNYFDKVILDAPCSGEGMIRKNETARLQWSNNLVLKMSNIQKSLIDIAYNCLKYDGILIYSTCTFSKEEDEVIIDYLIKKHSNTKLLDCNKIYFHNDIGEGQFFAILQKKEESSFEYTNPIKSKSLIDIKNEKNHTINKFKNFLNEYLNYDLYKDTETNIYLLNNKIYFINRNIPINDFNILNILRMGIEVAEIKNEKFYLSHNITHSKYEKYFRNNVELTEEESFKYLKGESFKINTNIEGYAIARYMNIPIGLCKVVNGTLKNHYPKGLRILH